MPGGKLIINNSTLTNIQECGDLWQGITVLGDSNLTQTEANQGVVKAINGAIIENAETGIYVGNPDNPNGDKNGGIVRINGATFRNNKTGVAFPNYHNSGNDNVSYIRNSTFETTDFLANHDVNPYAFIALWEVDGVEIINNTFINLNPDFYSNEGRGIISNHASFVSNNNTFENLSVGILSIKNSNIQANNCAFVNNGRDIKILNKYF